MLYSSSLSCGLRKTTTNKEKCARLNEAGAGFDVEVNWKAQSRSSCDVPLCLFASLQSMEIEFNWILIAIVVVVGFFLFFCCCFHTDFAPNSNVTRGRTVAVTGTSGTEGSSGRKRFVQYEKGRF